MNAAMQRIGTACRNLAPPVVAPILAIALAAVIGGASTVPAYAQESNGRYEQRQRDNRDHHRQYDRDRYRSNSYEHPAYVYAPPPVYYAPPPGPPVIDFVFPLRFR